MSVLIKGVKMPKSCAECDFIEYDDEYEFECWCPILRINVEEYTAEKYAGCPLVEIPPHGKLIDADKVTKKMEKIATEAWQMKLSDTVEHTLNMSMDIIKHAPTVIESEEREHE